MIKDLCFKYGLYSARFGSIFLRMMICHFGYIFLWMICHFGYKQKIPKRNIWLRRTIILSDFQRFFCLQVNYFEIHVSYMIHCALKEFLHVSYKCT
jgi:hypothetical protein